MLSAYHKLNRLDHCYNDYINQNALQFVTGAADLETGWDAYVAGLEQLGLPRYLEIMQASYDASTTK